MAPFSSNVLAPFDSVPLGAIYSTTAWSVSLGSAPTFTVMGIPTFYLLKARGELIQLLENGISFDNMAILHYGQDSQDACLRHAPLPSPQDYESQEHYRMTCEKIDDWLFNGFYHPRLRTISPLLYQLCRKYIRKFGRPGRKSPGAADQKLAILEECLYKKIPDWGKISNRYYEYYLLTNFLDIYEDYSFSKHLLFGIVKTHLLRLFIALPISLHLIHQIS